MSTFSINLETRSLLNVNREEYLAIEHIEQQLLESYTYAKLNLLTTVKENAEVILEANGKMENAMNYIGDRNPFLSRNRREQNLYNYARKKIKERQKAQHEKDGTTPTLKEKLKNFNDDYNPLAKRRVVSNKSGREVSERIRIDLGYSKPKSNLPKHAKASGKALGVAAGLGTGGVLMKNASDRVGVKADNAEALKDHADKMAEYKASLADD